MQSLVQLLLTYLIQTVRYLWSWLILWSFLNSWMHFSTRVFCCPPSPPPREGKVCSTQAMYDSQGDKGSEEEAQERISDSKCLKI